MCSRRRDRPSAPTQTRFGTPHLLSLLGEGLEALYSTTLTRNLASLLSSDAEVSSRLRTHFLWLVHGAQTDAYEVEIESLATSSKKKKKDNSAQKWEDLIERCRLHEAKLEVVLRLIDNETLSAEDVEPIMEQLDYLLEQARA
eukprot:6195367-Pleurochrysis_carterae.AAC.4